MNNPWVSYLFIRIGLFVGFLSLLMLLGIEPILAALFAAVLSLAVSILFLHKQRARVSEAIYKRTQKVAKEGIEDSDSDHENDLLDGKN